MPQSIRSSLGYTPAPAPAPVVKPVPFNGYYPKLLKGVAKRDGSGGSVWLVTAPRTGVIVHLAGRPQKAKHKLGYYTTRLKEADMVPFAGNINIAA